MDKTGLGSYSGRLWKAFLFISFRAANAANKRLLSVGTDGGGYITYYVPIKMISLMTAGAGRMEESLKREGLGAAAVPPPSSSALPEALALSAW